jgi:SAM-dependent methyltransferase
VKARRESPGEQLLDRGDLARAYEENQAWPPEVTKPVSRYFLSSLPHAPRRCLFLGTATGVNDVLPFARVADSTDRILAGDIEPTFLERLRDRVASEGLANIETRKLDISEDLTSLGKFDLVSLLFVIHRLKAWEEVVDRLCGLVAPGGSFFISEFVGPEGVIYLSNENGGTGADPVSHLIRRYFELLPDRFSPPLRSTSIGPVLKRIEKRLSPAGYMDFAWKQQITPSEMLRRITNRAYAPYFSIQPPREVLERLAEEFAGESGCPVSLKEIIRIYRFERARSWACRPAPPACFRGVFLYSIL